MAQLRRFPFNPYSCLEGLAGIIYKEIAASALDAQNITQVDRPLKLKKSCVHSSTGSEEEAVIRVSTAFSSTCEQGSLFQPPLALWNQSK